MRQYDPERKLLQFYAVSGGLRTFHVNRIVRIGRPIAGEAKFVGMHASQIGAMGTLEREKRRKPKAKV